MKTDEFLPIPAPETATDPIGSPADRQQRWRALMGELGFGERLLRFVLVGEDRRMVKVLTDVEVDCIPRAGMIMNLAKTLRDILADRRDRSTIAFLLTRPGYGGVTATDRRWATLLTHAAAEYGVPIEPIFRANDERLVLVEPDQVR